MAAGRVEKGSASIISAHSVVRHPSRAAALAAA